MIVAEVVVVAGVVVVASGIFCCVAKNVDNNFALLAITKPL